MWVLTVFLALLVPQLSTQQLVIETDSGKIQGTMQRTQTGKEIHAFLGIRYAESPTGALRFKNPEAAKPWDGIFEATQDSLVCPQPGVEQRLISEDCLKLNVFTRNITAKQPVIVYIHGGENMRGSGHSAYEAGPQYLLDYDVVLVAFNYRLGAFGFLSTQTSEAAGNFGYLDQLLALEWVQKHIHSFGGDPGMVTLLGVDAGSMAVTLHMASKLSRTLFQRAITMSGAATNHFDIDNVFWTRKLAREMKCPMYNDKDLLECLRSKNWEAIIEVCARWEVYGFTNIKWNYEVDGYFLEKHPLTAFEEGDFNKVPLVTGITRDELDFSLYHQEQNTGLLNDISLNFDLYAPEMFIYNDTASSYAYQNRGKRIQSFYFPNEVSITPNNLENLGQAFSDAIIGHGVHKLVALAKQKTPVYYYRFDYVGSKSRYVDQTGKPRGVGHIDDLRYVMPGTWYGPQMLSTDADIFMVDRMTAFWTSFARTGIPSIDTAEDFHWRPSNGSHTWTLYIDTDLKVNDPPYQERFRFWDDLLQEGEVVNGCSILKASAFAILAYVGLWGFLF